MKRGIISIAAGIMMLAGAAATCCAAEAETVRVGALKGPTSMGLVSLMEKAEAGETACSYEFSMVAAADELLGQMVTGDLDIVLIPANTASVLYNKMEGGISVLDINTLGVLYVAEHGEEISSVADLKGKTIYITGKGTTPDYVLQYLLEANGLTQEDVQLEYKSEATEVVAVMTADETAVGVLPQPFATSALLQDDSLRLALDLTEEWDQVQEEGGSSLVTGVTVVRKEFLEEHEDAVRDFLSEHEQSTAYTNENPAEAAEMIETLGIVAKAAIAEKAIPYCNIVCLQGEEMQAALEGYLQVLYDMDPASVGGSLPDAEFYYIQ